MKATLPAFLCLVFALPLFAQPRPALIPYRKGDKWGYCDTTKKILIPIQYESALPFINGKALVITVTDSLLQIDTKGKTLKILPYKLAGNIAGTDLFKMYKNDYNKLGLLNINGAIVLPPIYKSIDVLGVDSFEVKLLGKIGTINSKGDTLKKFAPYDEPKPGTDQVESIYGNPSDTLTLWGSFSEGMALVSANSLFGYAGKDTTLAIPCKYMLAEPFRHGLAKVTIKSPIQKKDSPVDTSRYTNTPPPPKAAPPPPGFEKAEVLTTEVINMEEGYIDVKGTEYWED